MLKRKKWTEMYILSIENYKISIENSQYALSQYYVKYSQYTLCKIFSIRYEQILSILTCKISMVYKKFLVYFMKIFTIRYTAKNAQPVLA